MAIDKNLFLHDLAIVAILKNEGHYLREWLDYHLLAGVDHFYLYDNDSPDNQAEVAAPYVEAGLVDYISLPGKKMQMVAYNDAVKKFKFQSRYMAFIDCDEFIYPKSNRSVVEIVDEILSQDAKAAALGINWQCFGSNGQEKADYSRGVLERFTRRAPNDWTPDGKGNAHIKTIADPRKIDFIMNPHFPICFDGNHSVNENGGIVKGPFNNPVTIKKISINHYHTKSREEYRIKNRRGRSDILDENVYGDEKFKSHDRNEEFDDGILKYRATRADCFFLETEAEKIRRVKKALSEILPKYASDEPFENKLATALTCRAVSHFLGEKFPRDIDCWQNFEKASLVAILMSLYNMTLNESQLLILELPDLFSLPYPVVEKLRLAFLDTIPKMMSVMQLKDRWWDYVELDYLQRLLRKI